MKQNDFPPHSLESMTRMFSAGCVWLLVEPPHSVIWSAGEWRETVGDSQSSATARTILDCSIPSPEKAVMLWWWERKVRGECFSNNFYIHVPVHVWLFTCTVQNEMPHMTCRSSWQSQSSSLRESISSLSSDPHLHGSDPLLPACTMYQGWIESHCV